MYLEDQDKLQTCNEDLFFEFKETFDGWAAERFEIVDQKTIRRLRKTLHRHGIYTSDGDDLKAIITLNQAHKPPK